VVRAVETMRFEEPEPPEVRDTLAGVGLDVIVDVLGATVAVIETVPVKPVLVRVIVELPVFPAASVRVLGEAPIEKSLTANTTKLPSMIVEWKVHKYV
jgi:hypothetical protein